MKRPQRRLKFRALSQRIPAALLLTALGSSVYAGNIAPEGIGLVGVNDSTITDLGTPHANSGTAAAVNDNEVSTRVDTFFPTDPTLTKSYVGVRWVSTRFDLIDTLTLNLATFSDGGWFGPNNVTPGPGLALAAAHLTTPSVQTTTNGGVTWTTVNVTSDYLAVMTGHQIGGGDIANPSSAVVTFTLNTPVSKINGIRLIGDNGGVADGNGFVGVFELEVNSSPGPDTDGDGMLDAWEVAHGLIVGTNDSGGNPDNDGLTNGEEFTLGTDPKNNDTDGDGLTDGNEVNVWTTNPLLADTDGDGLGDGREVNQLFTDPKSIDSDGDGLTDGDEVLTRLTNPNSTDTDGDGYEDGLEVAQGSDPKSPDSIPENFAIPALGGTAILGVKDGPDGEEVKYEHVGAVANLNDSVLTTRSDTYNGGAEHEPYSLSYAGITWAEPVPAPIARFEITMAAFFDGGWFGKNNVSPGAGNPLTAAHLMEPSVQIKTATVPEWTTVAATSDYTNKLTGFRIGGGALPNPTTVKLTFSLAEQAHDLTGIRLIGQEGGIGSRGFIGVFEIAIRPGPRDADNDGMEDSWERLNGLVVGTNDSALDADGDGLNNLAEFRAGSNPQDTDTDDDGLTDGAEANTHLTSVLNADTDGDGLSDGAEVNTHHTNPKSVDSDGDGFRDGVEVAAGTNPLSNSSRPLNVALIGAGILGVTTAPDAEISTPVFNSGAASAINDGDLNSRVDTFFGGAETYSFVGITWTNTIADKIASVRFTPSIFFDGGWFGVNSSGPGAGGFLTAETDLVEPELQISTDKGLTWTTVAHTSDYLTIGNNHPLPAVNFGEPTKFTATFTPSVPVSNISGIRLVGTEGGQASAGFLGVFEFEVNTEPAAEVKIVNVSRASGIFKGEFDTVVGKTYTVEGKNSLSDANWIPVAGQSFTGANARRTFTETSSSATRYYRVRAQ